MYNGSCPKPPHYSPSCRPSVTQPSTLQQGEEGEGEDADDGEVAVDNGDSALLLLRALAAQDEAVSGQLKGEGGLLATRSCVVM
jgi:hypothetical protein